MIPQRPMLESDAMRGRTALLIVACVAIGLVVPAIRAQQPLFDLVLRNARIVDGTGNPWFRADIAISGDAIAGSPPLSISRPCA